MRDGDRVIAETRRTVVLHESGFASRWYVAREDIDQSALTPPGFKKRTIRVTLAGRSLTK